MEFFRWMLVLTGCAMMFGAYFMGGRKVRTSIYHQSTPDAYDPSMDELSMPIEDWQQSNAPAVAERSAHGSVSQGSVGQGDVHQGDVHQGAVHRSADGQQGVIQMTDQASRSDQIFLSDEEIDASLNSASDDESRPVQVELDISDQFDEIDFGREAPEVAAREQSRQGVGNDSLTAADQSGIDEPDNTRARVESFSDAVKQVGLSGTPQSTVSDFVASTIDEPGFDFTQEFDVIPEMVQIEEVEEKLVTVHVAAPGDRRFFGNDLKTLFEQHDYKYGDMSIYHCTLEGDQVFSIANIVKPGTFNVDEMDSFETPGITLFMRLPIELNADVAFDFLVREATELAEVLGGQLRDADRNPLNQQTIQHMREDIQQYVFRTKKPLHA